MVNLNLLPVLHALLEEQSVVRAAESLSLAQPTVSGALAQLRKTLDDPLLVRVGRTMRLTPRAEELRPQVELICSDIERLLRPVAFDPAIAQRQFVVSAVDYVAFLLSRSLLTRLRDEAPGIRVHFVDVPIDLTPLLEDGSVDLAVCGNFGLWPTVRYQSLLQERFVAAVARDHPLAGRGRVSSAELAEFPGVNVSSSDAASAHAAKPITGLPSLDWPAQLWLGQFMDAAILAVDSPVVARGPSSLYDYLATILPLTVLELTDESHDVDTGMFWTVLQDADPAHAWLRSIISEALVPM